MKNTQSFELVEVNLRQSVWESSVLGLVMGDTKTLRALTLLVLLSTSTGYSLLPFARPLPKSLRGYHHRHCDRLVVNQSFVGSLILKYTPVQP